MLVREAESHGPVTPESLQAADQRLRSRKLVKRDKLLADPRTWDATAALGWGGLTADAVFASVHPFAAGSIGGVAALATVGAAGVIGGLIARRRRDQP
jgi:hypothetical protein